MKTLVTGIRRFLWEEEGANGVEYALLAGLIAIAFTAGAGLLGVNLNTFLTGIGNYIATFNPVAPG
jgi:Flp pilus assembly pilin Flp